MNNRTKTIFVLCIILMVLWKVIKFYNIHNEKTDSTSDLILLEKLKKMSQNEELSNKVKITVYYEALCSDSRNFVLRELVPTYQLLSENIQLDLVPYGKAQSIDKGNGKWDFQCQHGEIECLGNKVHSCVINLVTDQKKVLNMIACMIDDNIIPMDAAERCAKQCGVDYNSIAECTSSDLSSNLLEKYGIRTHKVHPSFIPTVELNGKMPVPLSVILKDLKTQVCATFMKDVPGGCM